MKIFITAVAICTIVIACTITAYASELPEDSGLLWLVNKSNPLSEDFQPTDLVEYRKAKVCRPAMEAFEKMLAVMEAEGISGLCLQSAYRPYGYQKAIFNQRVKELTAKGKSREEAIEAASHSIQPPGASEHQLGLALDVSINGKLTKEFADTPAGRWIDENCHKFGFIIRYPKSKTEVTDIVYEPWHLRYVGAPHAQIIKEQGLALEEYHQYLAHIHMYVVWGDDSSYYLVRYVDALPEELVCMEVSSTTPGRDSGYIITQLKTPV